MRIAIDAMGGDFAPQATVAGAVHAARQTSSEIVLVGVESVLREDLDRIEGGVPANIVIHHAPDVIESTESPTLALPSGRKAS